MDIDFKFTQRVKGKANIKTNDSLNIDFSHEITKEYTLYSTIYHRNHELSIKTDKCYNIDTLEFYDVHSSEESKLYMKVHFDLLQESDWDGNQIVYDICSERATQETRIAIDELTYVFTFEDSEEMINFISHYDSVDEYYNILEDYYHIIFIKKRDYKNYLKTKHWREKRL